MTGARGVPPSNHDFEVLRWLGVLALFSALVSLVRSVADQSVEPWPVKLARAFLTGLLTMAAGAALSTWLHLGFLPLLAFAGAAGALGEEFVVNTLLRWWAGVERGR